LKLGFAFFPCVDLNLVHCLSSSKTAVRTPNNAIVQGHAARVARRMVDMLRS
jgi:hypothetical protein